MKEGKKFRVDIWDLYGLSRDQLKELITDEALISFHCLAGKCDEIHLELKEDKLDLIKKFDNRIQVHYV